MVNVVMKHVPRLEGFAEEVCDLVVEDEKTKKFKNKKKRNMMQYKQERMENALITLRKRRKEEEGSKEHNPSSSSSISQVSTMSSLEGRGDFSVSSCTSGKSRVSRSTVTASMSFQKAVFDQLEQRKQREDQFSTESKENQKDASKKSEHPQSDLSQNGSHSSQRAEYMTDDEALKIIRQLIEFEYRNKKALYCAPRERADHAKYGGLIAADATSLRRYVSYFMHLFNVRHVNAVRPKMNEVYVYSTAMTAMFRDMREALNMSSSSPAQAVARRVLEISNAISTDDNVFRQ